MNLFKFQEGIYTKVVIPNEDAATLKIEYMDDVLTFYLNDKPIFSGDWTVNFMEVFTILLKELQKEA